MKIVPFYYNDIDDLCANTYVLIDENNNTVIIDPSKKYDGLVNYVKKNNLNLKAILLTHSHVDHFRGAELLVKTFNAPVYIGFYDAPGLKDTYANCGMMLGEETKLNVEPKTVVDGEKITFLSEPIEVLDTPYHTHGAVCYYLKDSGILFSGDSLFKGGFGRNDLPTSIRSKQMDSIGKLFSLPDNTKVLPGHGASTEIGKEKRNY